MRYLYLFVALFVAGALCAWAAWRWLGAGASFIIGALALILAIVLFYFNKSDSVADTAIEYVADATPPLVSFSLVLGWWAGWAALRALRSRGWA